MKKYYKIESTSGYKPYFVTYVGAEDVHTVPQFQAHGFKSTVFNGIKQKEVK
jgi:hypothetical protein